MVSAKGGTAGSHPILRLMLFCKNQVVTMWRRQGKEEVGGRCLAARTRHIPRLARVPAHQPCVAQSGNSQGRPLIVAPSVKVPGKGSSITRSVDCLAVAARPALVQRVSRNPFVKLRPGSGCGDEGSAGEIRGRRRR